MDAFDVIWRAMPWYYGVLAGMFATLLGWSCYCNCKHRCQRDPDCSDSKKAAARFKPLVRRPRLLKKEFCIVEKAFSEAIADLKSRRGKGEKSLRSEEGGADAQLAYKRIEEIGRAHF